VVEVTKIGVKNLFVSYVRTTLVVFGAPPFRAGGAVAVSGLSVFGLGSGEEVR